MIKTIRNFEVEGLVTWVKHSITHRGINKTVIRVEGFDQEYNRRHGFFITFFNEIAYSVMKNIQKHDSVNVKGYLNNNIYENKKGDLISETQLIGNQYELIDDIELPVYKSVEDGIEQLKDED